ncbi:MAG: ABC-2 transporter permease [Ruminococcaceae bacterium]|nr:ABC-2 transporter permease [Oscillospiraceae bacterium]
MHNIFMKELRLSASILSYLFIAFAIMFFLPGYPILCGVFFVTLGIFQSFQNAREANDIVFSALLPIAKRDVVKGKFLFVCFIELCAFFLMALVTVIRMTIMSGSEVYRHNALMNANLFALGMALLIFGLFNLIFVGGFFRTAHKFAKPFVTYIIAAFLAIGAGEAAHHFPGLAPVNAFGFEHLGLQFALLATGAACYAMLTRISFGNACGNFENINL